MKGLVLLDLILANKEELVREVKIGVTLGCSDHEMVEFSVLRVWKKCKENDHNPGLGKSRLWLV